MSENILSESEIISLLPRLNNTDKRAAGYLAASIPGARIEVRFTELSYDSKHNPIGKRYYWREVSQELLRSTNGRANFRITVPIPPKQGKMRCIRRDEMPERVKIRWRGGYEEYPEEKSLELYLSSINKGRGGFDVEMWSGDDGHTWNSTLVKDPDELQAPIIINTLDCSETEINSHLKESSPKD